MLRHGEGYVHLQAYLLNMLSRVYKQVRRGGNFSLDGGGGGGDR
jgi:hypothetical protein